MSSEAPLKIGQSGVGLNVLSAEGAKIEEIPVEPLLGSISRFKGSCEYFRYDVG